MGTAEGLKTETSTTETLTAETSTTEAPPTEKSIAESPATETAIEAPAAETPSTEAASKEVSSTEKPITEEPRKPIQEEPTEIPKVDTSLTEKPVAVENIVEETSNRDSYQATKEEIEDSLEFIKAKLNPPEAPVKTKRLSKEIKHVEEEDIPAPPPADVVIPLPIVVPNKV